MAFQLDQNRQVRSDGRRSERSLASIPALAVRITDGQATISAPATGLTSERAAVLIEIYRRAGFWKVRCVSAGWAEGLSALVREHGVSVEDDAAAGTGATPQASISADLTLDEPRHRSVAGEEKLSLVKRKTLDLRKREVLKVLLTKGAAGREPGSSERQAWRYRL